MKSIIHNCERKGKYFHKRCTKVFYATSVKCLKPLQGSGKPEVSIKNISSMQTHTQLIKYLPLVVSRSFIHFLFTP